MIKHYNLHIFGRVQGVNFRHQSKMEADRLGIVGLIKNEPDGSVYVEAEGSETALKKFVDWCRSGLSFARVTDIEVKERAVVGYSNFEIKY